MKRESSKKILSKLIEAAWIMFSAHFFSYYDGDCRFNTVITIYNKEMTLLQHFATLNF